MKFDILAVISTMLIILIVIIVNTVIIIIILNKFISFTKKYMSYCRTRMRRHTGNKLIETET